MLKQYFRSSLFIVVSAFLVAAAPDAARPDKDSREPVVITSDRMKADKLGEMVTFSGKVTLKKEEMTLSADQMIVYYNIGSKDIREIEVHGNVVVHKEGRVALSKNAWYYSLEEKIVLTGDARIIENENQLGGEKITLFMRDDRSIVEGGKVLLYKDKQDKTLDTKKRK